MPYARLLLALPMAFCLSFAGTDDPKHLPAALRELAGSQQSWELERQQKLAQMVVEKREMVANTLDEEPGEETWKGNLGGALAIRTKLEALTLADLPAGTSEPAAPSAPWTEKALTGTTCLSGGREWSLLDSGMGTVNGKETPDRWKVETRGLLSLFFPGFDRGNRIDFELLEGNTVARWVRDGEVKVWKRLASKE